MLKTMDEVLCKLQSADRYQRDTITISGNYAEVAQTFAFDKPHEHYSNRTLSFRTHSFGSR